MYELRRHGKTFKIYETKTKQYIAKYKCKDQATDAIFKLNSGSGFNGVTPKFLMSGEKSGIDMDKKIEVDTISTNKNYK